MTRREKAILMLVMVTAIWGGYGLFFSPSPNSGHAIKHGNKEDLKILAEKLAAVLRFEESLQNNLYIIERASSEWEQDPFLQSHWPTKRKKEVASGPKFPKLNLTYSGYLETADRKLAIINGKEYQRGDRLEDSPYIVQNISPSRVLLGDGLRKSRFILHLKEMN